MVVSDDVVPPLLFFYSISPTLAFTAYPNPILVLILFFSFFSFIVVIIDKLVFILGGKFAIVVEISNSTVEFFCAVINSNKKKKK